MIASDYPIQVSPLADLDGGGFIASAIDLPGCVSDGETPEEALRNIYDAIESWIEEARAVGRPLPSPQPVLKSA